MRRSCCDTSDMRKVAVSMKALSVEHFGVLCSFARRRFGWSAWLPFVVHLVSV